MVHHLCGLMGSCLLSSQQSGVLVQRLKALWRQGTPSGDITVDGRRSSFNPEFLLQV